MLSDEELPPLHESSTPLFKIRANLAKVPKNELTTTKFAVLVSTGTKTVFSKLKLQFLSIPRGYFPRFFAFWDEMDTYRSNQSISLAL